MTPVAWLSKYSSRTASSAGEGLSMVSINWLRWIPVCRSERHPALPIRKLHGQHRASTVPVDADGDLHGLSPDHAVGADLLVPHVQNQVAAGELLQIAVEPLVDPADTGCRKPMGRESSRTTSSGPSRPPKTSAMGNQLAAFTLHVLFSHADQTGSCEIGQRTPTARLK